MCRETLEGLFSLSMEVVRYRTYSEHRRKPSATAPNQDPMPSLQWKDMKWSFIRYNPPKVHNFHFSLPNSQWYLHLLLAGDYLSQKYC